MKVQPSGLAPPPLDPLLDIVHQSIERHEMLPAPVSGQRWRELVVGVSGGLDSVALLYLLHQLAAPLYVHLHVAHLDHALRPESAEDAAFVAKLAAKWSLPFHSRRLQPHETDGAGEAAMRQLRYDFLCAVARRVSPAGQTPVVAVAHHADDQAETVLFRLTRGSGVAGLAGMRSKGEWQSNAASAGSEAPVPVHIVRPLLSLRRGDLHNYALQHGLTWREDATNHDVTLARNRLRHLVLPQLEQINSNAVISIGRTAQLLADAADQLDEGNEQLLDALTLDQTTGERIVLDLVRLHRLGLSHRRAVLHSALQRTFSMLSDLTFDHVERLAATLADDGGHGGPHPLLAGVGWTIGASPPVIGERTRRPDWLSLHAQRALPLRMNTPWLDETIRLRLPLLLEAPGVLEVGDGWTLQTALHTLADEDILPVTCDPWQAWLDAERCGELCLNTPAPGMHIAPVGMAGKSKTIGDYFTDRKLPATLRGGWPLLISRSTNVVLWVCGYAIGNQAALRPGTRRLLHLHWRAGE
jgi:tRNA(Ile)-lysidine synthase